MPIHYRITGRKRFRTSSPNKGLSTAQPTLSGAVSLAEKEVDPANKNLQKMVSEKSKNAGNNNQNKSGEKKTKVTTTNQMPPRKRIQNQ